MGGSQPCTSAIRLDSDTGNWVKNPSSVHTIRLFSVLLYLWDCSSVPWKGWNFARILGRSAGSVELCLCVLPGDSTQDSEREGYQCPNHKNNADCSKRKSGRWPVHDGHRVQERKGQEEWSAEEEASEKDVPNPHFTFHLHMSQIPKRYNEQELQAILTQKQLFSPRKKNHIPVYSSSKKHNLRYPQWEHTGQCMRWKELHGCMGRIPRLATR